MPPFRMFVYTEPRSAKLQPRLVASTALSYSTALRQPFSFQSVTSSSSPSSSNSAPSISLIFIALRTISVATGGYTHPPAPRGGNHSHGALRERKINARIAHFFAINPFLATLAFLVGGYQFHFMLESAGLKRLQRATIQLSRLPAVRVFPYECVENIIQSHGNRP